MFWQSWLHSFVKSPTGINALIALLQLILQYCILVLMHYNAFCWLRTLMDICLALRDRFAFIQHSCRVVFFFNVKMELNVTDTVCFFMFMPSASQRSAKIHSNQVNSTLSCNKNPLLSFSQSYADLLFFRIRYSGKWIRNCHSAKAHQTYWFLWDLKPGRRKLYCFLMSFLQMKLITMEVQRWKWHIFLRQWKMAYISVTLEVFGLSLHHHPLYLWMSTLASALCLFSKLNKLSWAGALGAVSACTKRCQLASLPLMRDG